MSSLGRLVPLATVIALCTLSFARSSGAIAQFSAHDDRTILVLGSGGVLGTALTGELLSHGYTILQVRNRLDIDLRLKGSLDIFNNETIDFCFFLASEWGDPKRTLQDSVQDTVWHYNVLLYDNVLSYLQQRSIPYIFTSSHLAAQNTTRLGRAKRLGEELVAKSGVGKSVRLYNVFGPERINSKSHLLSDWLYSCVRRGAATVAANGHEQHQFAHAEDVSHALLTAMMDFGKLQQLTVADSGQWISMNDLAATINTLVPCKVRFSGAGGRGTAASGQPADTLRVATNLPARLKEMVQHVRSLARESYTWQSRRPYLSIIFATSNDEYTPSANREGVRSRIQRFMQSVAQTAEAVHLDYELIAVQYHPILTTDYASRDQYKPGQTDLDLPLSQLFPWTSRQSFGRLRVITITPEHHTWPNNKKYFAEFLGKNAGALRARGQFLLFTNPDEIYPHGVFGQLAKQQLQRGGLMYRAGLFISFQLDPTRGMLEQCGRVAETGNMCYIANLWCPDGVEKRSDLHANMLGDFSVWWHEDFLRTGGYVVIPQNRHIETAHWQFVSAQFGLQDRWMDAFTCHQDHTRRRRPWTDLKGTGVEKLYWKDFEANPTHQPNGLPGVQLPEAAMHDILEAGYNPETPFVSYSHDALFHVWPLHRGSLQPDNVLDFLGIRTNHTFDCQDFDRTRFLQLARRIPCDRHDEFVRRRMAGKTMLGDLPVMDGEYFGWLSLLRAVAAAARNRQLMEPFVVVDLGARYGTWAVRGGAAMRRRQPARRVQLLGVEPDPTSFEWMRQHVAMNGLSEGATLVQGVVGTESVAAVEVDTWEKASPGKVVVPQYTVSELLEGVMVVDIIHCDIQGAEAVFLRNDTLDVLDARVKTVHFITHSEELHRSLVAAFESRGWRVVHNMVGSYGKDPGRMSETPFGPVRLRESGVLAVENVRYFHAPLVGLAGGY